MQLALSDRLQSEMRREHYDGAPGVLTSAVVWLSASAICFIVGTFQGVWALLIGGAMIYLFLQSVVPTIPGSLP